MNIQRLNVRIDQVGLLVDMIIIIIKLIMMMTIIKVMMIIFIKIIMIIKITFLDQVEEDLLTEKLKIKKVSDDLNQTFEDMINMSV